MSKVFMVTKVKEESVGKQEFKWETQVLIQNIIPHSKYWPQNSTDHVYEACGW